MELKIGATVARKENPLSTYTVHSLGDGKRVTVRHKDGYLLTEKIDSLEIVKADYTNNTLEHSYGPDDGYLTNDQVEAVKRASSATNIPEENFSNSLFTEDKTEIFQTLSERGSRYGRFNSVATIVQDLKSVMQKSPNWEKLTASQKEALEMIQHKIARMLNGDPTYIDNAVDIVGYATLMMKNMQGDLEI